ncbi:hypothetical protein [Roseiflexus sp.]|uniref:hypothetical protein n=1 Tax=Roseiflexus sp. TaxID=2562120 RepID=UPI00398A7727
MTAEFVRPMRTIALLAGGGALLGIAITGAGSWTLTLLGIVAVCGMILSFISWTEFESGTSESSSALIKSRRMRRMLVILLEGGFWVAMTGLLMLATLGQSRTAAYNVLLVVSLVFLVPSMRLKQLCSITSPVELVGEIVVVMLLTTGILFMLSL